MRPISFTRSQPAADADSVAAAQLLNDSGVITLDGTLASDGVAALTVPAYVTAFSEESMCLAYLPFFIEIHKLFVPHLPKKAAGSV